MSTENQGAGSESRGTQDMKITRLVPWFGANAANDDVPAKLLAGCKWVFVPFAGSMCEVKHFPASVQIMVSDLHDELMTLAGVIADEMSWGMLAELLAKKLFHPAELEAAQRTLREHRAAKGGGLFGGAESLCDEVDIAAAYFVCAWMGRSGVSGTKGELNANLALRYDAGGGDPVTRYRSAVESLGAWHEALKRCSFTREDAFEVLERIRKRAVEDGIARLNECAQTGKMPADDRCVGVYMDPPWPDDGAGYLHAFTDAQQRRLAKLIAEIPATVRIVMRWGDHPLIRELYPESPISGGWEWRMVDGRDQENKAKAEVFLVRRA